MSITPLSYLDSYNARQLSVADVARDFVAPSQFYQLLGLNHCVLIGPRGSGKTTLLKMLQADSSRLISLSDDATTLPDVAFIGIFVPADVRWAKQLAAHVEGIQCEETKKALYELAFGTSAFLALLETIDKCIEVSKSSTNRAHEKFKFILDRQNEVTLALRLSELWSTPISVPSLSELKHKLRIRQIRFPAWATQIRNGVPLHELSAQDPYLALGWLDGIVTAIETINEFIGKPDQRWALLLDELEIVPASLLQSIVTCLRSTSSQLIFKLALSPSSSGVFSRINEDEPTQGNDFTILNLWYNEREDLRSFAARLLCQSLKHRGLEISEANLPMKIGRSSIYEEDSNEEDLELSESKLVDGSLSKEKRQTLFAELANKDESFKDFLLRSRIDLENLDLSDRKKQGPLIRKVTPLVQFRNRAIKSWAQGKSSLRSGKIAHEPYFGYPNILDITEGNPRWILNLAELLDAERLKKSLPISAQGVQAAAITAMHRRFAAMLKVYPVNDSRTADISTLYAFLATLAGTIRKKLYHDAFSPDPAQSFEIDSDGAREYGAFLETAIHLGALVIMNPESPKRIANSTSNAGLVGSRVRLCYRLAPEFFLPLRSTSQTKVSSAMSKNAPERKKKEIESHDSNQKGLF